MAQPPTPMPQVRRMLGARGRAHLVRTGIERRRLADLYHSLITAPWPVVVLSVAGLYLAANVLFALGYVLDRGGVQNMRPGSFRDAFFFSVQTMSTIGYGGMIPRSLTANVLVAVEALVGLLGFAMGTGILFAKFSRPSARVLFSRVAAVAPRDRVPSLLFRMANERTSHIVEAQVRVVLARNETTAEGESLRRFHDLRLLRSQSPFFALTWTAVHPITPESPLWQQTREALLATDTEIIVSLVGLDAISSQTVHARHSYAADEIRWDARFVDILSRLPDGRLHIDYRRFHDTVPVPPEATPGPGPAAPLAPADAEPDTEPPQV